MTQGPLLTGTITAWGKIHCLIVETLPGGDTPATLERYVLMAVLTAAAAMIMQLLAISPS
jgi:hypothetical protein